MLAIAHTSRQTQVALHESAHAVACVFFGVAVERVTVRRKPGEYAGALWHGPITDPRAACVIAAAGPAAVADRRGFQVVAEDAALIDRSLSTVPAAERGRIARECAASALGLVTAHRALIAKLADLLLDKQELTGSEVHEFLSYWGFP